MSDAQNVFDKEGDIVLDGHTLFIDFAGKRSSVNYGGWERDLDLDESSKNSLKYIVCGEILEQLKYCQFNKYCWLFIS